MRLREREEGKSREEKESEMYCSISREQDRTSDRANKGGEKETVRRHVIEDPKGARDKGTVEGGRRVIADRVPVCAHPVPQSMSNWESDHLPLHRHTPACMHACKREKGSRKHRKSMEGEREGTPTHTHTLPGT